MVHHPRETGKLNIKTDRCTKFRLNFGTSVCFVYFLLPSFFFPISSPFSLPFSFPSRSHLATQTFLSKSVYQRADSFLFSGKYLATHTFSAKTMYQGQTRRHRDLNRTSEGGQKPGRIRDGKGRDPETGLQIETGLRIMFFYYLCGRF